MKLINKTKVSDDCLIAVLKDAAHSLDKGINTNIVIIVSQGRGYTVRGAAVRCRGFLFEKEYIKTHGGRFKIILPCPRPEDALQGAINFFNVAQHEWGHIYDFQYDLCHEEKLEWDRRTNGRRRRMAHDSRPQEKRADEYVRKAKPVDYYIDSIVNLAVEIENITNSKTKKR